MNAHSTGRPPPRRPIPPLSVGRARLTGRACPPFPPALTDEGGGRRSSPIWRRPKTPEPGGAALAGVPIGRGFVRDRGGGGGGGHGRAAVQVAGDGCVSMHRGAVAVATTGRRGRVGRRKRWQVAAVELRL